MDEGFEQGWIRKIASGWGWSGGILTRTNSKERRGMGTEHLTGMDLKGRRRNITVPESESKTCSWCKFVRFRHDIA